MQTLIDHKVGYDDYELHLINTKKFKTNTIALKFSRPIEREDITKRALIPFVLQKGSAKYPTERDLRLELDELYGAKFSITSAKKGENHIITFTLDLANEKFIEGEDELLHKGISFLHEIANNPKLDGDKFDSNIVEKEKETLENKINSIIDEKMQYANMRLIDEMCKDEKFGIRSHGYLEDFDDIDAQSLYDSYQKMITEDQLDIYIVGDLDEEHAKSILESKFQINRNPNASIRRVEPKEPSEEKDITEAQKIQQGKLHLGYRTGITYQDEQYPALQVFNGIFGGFPHSKLFLNVREKHSLAYYAASRFESHKGLLFVFSGIAPEKYGQAKDIIMEQHEAIKKGEVSDDELEQTKKTIIHSLKETIDRPRGIINWYYQQVIGGKEMTNQEMVEAIQSVTKEQVIAVSKQVRLDTVYFLTAEDGGAENE
ncbi:EF-P 5-aminopentanol modification-associated protein YfmF [Alkalibacillus haloalkaliphilus]|uniref:Putative inactive metalloprotease YmfF n=1 Tax=Alkalibacillus haloalkaliphilus TaxID=94136 RepID=A0A511W1M0_9BACI|nr:pitrilysin family protein [Alkalibacillus haloalkaliphilus]GEN44979.1 putative inactive metalloprotease YmfF [Alkalibacillus haloalkaliphilus]